MTLPASGNPISFSQINTELGLTSTAQISMNDAAVRSLFGVASGAISMSDGRGKSNSGGYGAIIQTNLVYNLSALPFNSGNVPGFNDAGCWGCCNAPGDVNEFYSFAYGYPGLNNYLSIDELCGLGGGLNSHTAWGKLAKIEAYNASGGLIQSVNKASFIAYNSVYNEGALAYAVPFSGTSVFNGYTRVASYLKWYFNV